LKLSVSPCFRTVWTLDTQLGDVNVKPESLVLLHIGSKEIKICIIGGKMRLEANTSDSTISIMEVFNKFINFVRFLLAGNNVEIVVKSADFWSGGSGLNECFTNKICDVIPWTVSDKDAIFIADCFINNVPCDWVVSYSIDGAVNVIIHKFL